MTFRPRTASWITRGNFRGEHAFESAPSGYPEIMDTKGKHHRSTRMRARALTVFRRGAAHGFVAGTAGVAVMTLGEKLEQRWTRRPNSHEIGRAHV